VYCVVSTKAGSTLADRSASPQ